jgi:arylsulfatase A-like enzyme
LQIRRSLPSVAAVWLAAAGLHASLQFLSAGEPQPVGTRLFVLGLEFVGLAVAIAAVSVPFLLLASSLERRPAVWRILRIVLVALGLLALWSSWGMFWLSGRFLDREGLRFVLRNFSDVYGIVLRSSPILALGAPFGLVIAAILACEAIPPWAAKLPERIPRVVERCALGLLGLSFGLAVGGLATSGHRQANAGPLTHLLAWTTGGVSGDLFDLKSSPELRRIYMEQAGRFVRKPRKDLLDEGPPDASAVFERRPLVSMEQYLSTVDRAALRRWNVIVVLLDSFRADQLRATGGARDVMPGLEALAREGRSYPDCYTVASHTDYAAPSVFSSHYPLRARFVHRYPASPGYPRVMVYDVLKALGWRTAFFSSQNEDWGGMLNYYQTGGLETVFHPRMAGFPEPLLKLREPYTGSLDDAATMTEAMKWTEADPAAPFFLYLNLQNCHLPFRIPADFPRRFGPSEIPFTITAGNFPREKVAVVKELYADSLAYVDVQLTRLFDRLKERGAWDRTIVVVTGDHGESFYEHGAPAHANGVYEEEMRVPLVLRAPGLAPLRDPRPAQLIDVAPGLLHLLGLPIHPSFQGTDLVGPPPPADRIRALVSQTGWKTFLAAAGSGFKLIRNGETGGAVLYDLARDPGETRDASADHPEAARKLRSWLKTWRWGQVEYYETPDRWGREYPPVITSP